MHTCIPVRGAGVAALVFSPEGAQQLESSAREIGFLFLDIHRLKADGGLISQSYEFDAKEGGMSKMSPLNGSPNCLNATWND